MAVNSYCSVFSKFSRMPSALRTTDIKKWLIYTTSRNKNVNVLNSVMLFRLGPKRAILNFKIQYTRRFLLYRIIILVYILNKSFLTSYKTIFRFVSLPMQNEIDVCLRLSFDVNVTENIVTYVKIKYRIFILICTSNRC